MYLSSLAGREPPLEWDAEGFILQHHSHVKLFVTFFSMSVQNPRPYANTQCDVDFIKDAIMFAAANQTCRIDVFPIWKCGRQYSTVIAKITPRDVCRDACRLAA